jgi:hypothetical protein
MKHYRCYGFALLIVAVAPMFSRQPTVSAALWRPVEAALGRSGQMQPGDVFKFAMPRKDLKVIKDGVTIEPGLALGSWAAFTKMGDETMLMGDLVLTEDEIEPVMLRLQQQGIEQSSIHNHLLGETPHVIYMHVSERGDAIKLAANLASALALTKTPGGLRNQGIEVEAMHNHMLNHDPHLYFMHFWATDDATKLAQGLRAALDQTNSVNPAGK